MTEAQPRKRGRRGNPAARRQAILDAALDRFLAEGFAAASLESVARQAGVAKGTIYLYFEDKEALFRALIRETLGPVLGRAEALVPASPDTTRALLHRLVQHLVGEVLETDRKRLLRLVITEAPRFPWLAEFYWHEVVQRAVQLVRAIARRGMERGEFGSDALERFPQLLPAPLFISLLWTTLFDRFEPLDVRAFFETHLDLLLAGLERTKT